MLSWLALNNAFNNREIASLIWIGVFILWMVANKNRRSVLAGFHKIIRMLFGRPILTSLLVMISYVSLCVYFLSYIGFWGLTNLKTTLIWGVTFAFVTMMDIKRISEEKNYFKQTAGEIVGATAIIVFIAESYTFSLWAELVLVPFLTLVGIMHAYSEVKEEDPLVTKFLSRLLIFLGLSFVGYGVYKIFNNFSEFATFETLKDFLVPIILSLLFLPFIYLLNMYVTYELVFALLRHRIKDKKISRYALTKAFLSFRTDLDFLQRWKRFFAAHDVKTKEEIISSIREVNALKQREKNPPTVPKSQGWSPYEAIRFLEIADMLAGDYHRLHDAWYAQSKYKKLGKTVLDNTICYYIEGNETAATCLTLELNVYDSSQAEAANKEFTEIAKLLLKKALGEDYEPNEPNEIIDLLGTSEIIHERKSIQTKRRDWNSTLGTYSQELIIKNLS